MAVLESMDYLKGAEKNKLKKLLFLLASK